VLVHILEVVVFASSIDNHKEVLVGNLSDDAIIIDATLLVHNKRESCLSRSKVLEISHGQSFEECESVLSDDPDLTHVRNIKETGLISAMEVLLDDTLGIEDGHIVTSEGDHLGLQGILVVTVEMGDFEGGGCSRSEGSPCIGDSLSDHLYILINN
jgi:hypothetical protein